MAAAANRLSPVRDVQHRGISANYGRCAGASGFTLLEVLAVLLIGALLMSFLVPNLSALDSRSLRDEAEKLVASIDLARQRSVVTGSAHQLVVSIEEGSYGLEWERSEPISQKKARPPADHTYRSGDTAFDYSDQISLSPPPGSGTVTLEPLPGLMGRFEALPEKIAFKGVETLGGWVNTGEIIVRFERDGSASFSTIVLADVGGREAHLEILPLADSVRIVYEEP